MVVHDSFLESERHPLSSFNNGPWASLKCAAAGISYAISSQRNMKIHLVCGLAVALFVAIFPLALFEQIALFFCVALVFAAELFNTSIESIVDLYSPRIDPRAKIAKDAAAGAVLLIAVCAVFIFYLVANAQLRNLESVLEKIRLFGVPAVTILLCEISLLTYPSKRKAKLSTILVACSLLSLWSMIKLSANTTPLILALIIIAISALSIRQPRSDFIQ